MGGQLVWSEFFFVLLLNIWWIKHEISLKKSSFFSCPFLFWVTVLVMPVWKVIDRGLLCSGGLCEETQAGQGVIRHGQLLCLTALWGLSHVSAETYVLLVCTSVATLIPQCVHIYSVCVCVYIYMFIYVCVCVPWKMTIVCHWRIEELNGACHFVTEGYGRRWFVLLMSVVLQRSTGRRVICIIDVLVVELQRSGIWVIYVIDT